MKTNGRVWIGALVLTAAACLSSARAQDAEVNIGFGERLGAMEMNKMGLGQGGLSEEPMWEDRITEIRALKPRLIRLFIQEYFQLLTDNGEYHFDILDRSVKTILKTGAQPLMCICFKPRPLFPSTNQDVVEPNDYEGWEKLVFNLVQHYEKPGGSGWHWEIANEPDIGEDGGCPYRFKPENYTPYYRHTAAAILKADPRAKVGGPALANVRSPLLPALLDAADKENMPLHFISWHIYSSSPAAVRDTVVHAKSLLSRHPALKVETVLDEWNMDLMNPPLDPRFQPCYAVETIWQMKEAGLDYSCYYHIRDYYVDIDRFAPFFSPQGAAFMARWWNRMPQFDGLFDYQNHIRPAYFAFKLLSRFAGDRLRLSSTHPAIHGFAARDDRMLMENLLLWNFSDKVVPVSIKFDGLADGRRVRHIVLDAAVPSPDENARLRLEPFFQLAKDSPPLKLRMEPYSIHYWSLEQP